MGRTSFAFEFVQDDPNFKSDALVVVAGDTNFPVPCESKFPLIVHVLDFLSFMTGMYHIDVSPVLRLAEDGHATGCQWRGPETDLPEAQRIRHSSSSWLAYSYEYCLPRGVQVVQQNQRQHKPNHGRRYRQSQQQNQQTQAHQPAATAPVPAPNNNNRNRQRRKKLSL